MILFEAQETVEIKIKKLARKVVNVSTKMIDIPCLSNLFLGWNHWSIHCLVIIYFNVTNSWLSQIHKMSLLDKKNINIIIL